MRLGVGMLRRVALLGAVSALALSGHAAVAGPNDWTGFNVSVGGGISKNEGSLDVSTANADRLDIFPVPSPFISIIGEATGSSSLSDDDWKGFGSLQGGYDQQFGNIVVGGFANFDFYPGDNQSSATQGIDGSVTFVFLPPLFPFPAVPISNYASVTSSVELKNTWSIGGRLGYLFTPNTLVYGLGGYTEANIDGTVELSYITNFNPGPLSLRISDELRGYFVGGGGEVKVADNVALRLEYRYAKYQSEGGSQAFNFSDGIPLLIDYSQSARVQADLDAQIHTVRGAIVLQLGNP